MNNLHIHPIHEHLLRERAIDPATPAGYPSGPLEILATLVGILAMVAGFLIWQVVQQLKPLNRYQPTLVLHQQGELEPIGAQQA